MNGGPARAMVTGGQHVDDGTGKPLCGGEGRVGRLEAGAERASGWVGCRACLERLGITPITRTDLAAAATRMGLPVPSSPSGPLPTKIVDELERRKRIRERTSKPARRSTPPPGKRPGKHPSGRIIPFPGHRGR